MTPEMKQYKSTHTSSELKKMSTESLHRLYTHLTGYTVFNPYTERDAMITVIWAHEQGITSDMAVQSTVDAISNGFDAQASDIREESSRKYTNSSVNAMRDMYATGEWSIRAIATEFGGSIKGTEKIIKGMSYRTGGRSIFVAYQPPMTPTQIISEYITGTVDTSWFDAE